MSYSKKCQSWVELFNVRKGSIVRVVRAAKHGENGWSNVWNTAMDKFIGKNCIVTDNSSSINSSMGLTLDLIGEESISYSFPFFVLAVIAEPKTIEIEDATPDYNATIHDGFVEINGSKIPFEKMAELRAALKQYKES